MSASGTGRSAGGESRVVRCYTHSPERIIKRIFYALLAVAAFWWAAESYMEVGFAGPTFLFSGFGAWLAFSAITGAG